MASMLQTGSAASSLLLPTPSNPLVDDLVWEPLSPRADPIQRVQTVTLQPVLTDVVTVNWPARVDDMIINKPGSTSIRMPLDACGNVTWGLASGTATKRCVGGYTYVDLPASPDPQPWVTVTYQTRTRVARNRELITITAGAATNPPNPPYEPFTVTVIYTRYLPVDREDYWGYTQPVLKGASPVPTGQSIEEGWMRWVTTSLGIEGTVVISEPLLGSHLTVTQLYVSTLTPTIDGPTFFTAVLENRGVMTAFRWFPVELYVRPASWPSPASIKDHVGGVGAYGNFAFLKPFGSPPDSSVWQIEQLGAGMSMTLQTAITFTTELGDLRVYAQPDVWFDGDPGHYAENFGCNPDGYGNTPESNVKLLPQPIFVPIAYRVDASPPALTQPVPPGQTGTFVPQIRNVGNMTDTYTVTVVSAGGWLVSHSPSPQVLPGASRPLTVQVTVPAGTSEETVDQTTVTIQSKGDPGRSRTVWLYTVARKLHFYLPVITKRN